MLLMFIICKSTAAAATAATATTTTKGSSFKGCMSFLSPDQSLVHGPGHLMNIEHH